jgi:carbon-monoxide dehydrogenase medium subunit
MYPASFEYHRAGTVDEAVALLIQHGEDAKLLAGGHSLLPVMRLRFAQPKHLIDIRKIPTLAGIRETDGALVIGATTTHRQLEASELLRRRHAAIADAASQIGDMQVRNMGTIGGSLAHADPAADLPAVMLALDAEITALGPRGERRIMASDFFQGLMTTALAADEVLTSVRIPDATGRAASAYVKQVHAASRYAVVGVAVALGLDGADTARSARVAVTGLGFVATRARAVEQALAGRALDDAALNAAAARVVDGIEIREDATGNAAYKRHIAVIRAREAIERAWERARAG